MDNYFITSAEHQLPNETRHTNVPPGISESTRSSVCVFIFENLKLKKFRGLDNSDDDDDSMNTPKQSEETSNQGFEKQVESKKKQLLENDISYIVSCHTGDYLNRSNTSTNLVSLLRRVN